MLKTQNSMLKTSPNGEEIFNKSHSFIYVIFSICKPLTGP